MVLPSEMLVPGAFLYGAVLVGLATVLGIVALLVRADGERRRAVSRVGQYGMAMAALLTLGHLVTWGHLTSGAFQTLFVGVLAAVGGYKIHERGQKAEREARRR